MRVVGCKSNAKERRNDVRRPWRGKQGRSEGMKRGKICGGVWRSDEMIGGGLKKGEWTVVLDKFYLESKGSVFV